MRSVMMILGLTLLAGCGGPVDEPIDNRVEAPGDMVAVPAPPPPDAPPAAAPAIFAFAGDWAVSDFLCENNGVWTFARDKVVTDGETACEVDSIAGESTTGATLEMSCTAEGTASKQRWELRAADRGRMSVVQYENGVERPGTITLQRCG